MPATDFPTKARAGMRMGHGEVLDHMFYDGLQSPFDGQLMGTFAEATAQKYGFSRVDQDAFATEYDAARAACGGVAAPSRRRSRRSPSRAARAKQVVDRD